MVRRSFRRVNAPRRAFVAAVASQGPPIEKDRHLVKEFGGAGRVDELGEHINNKGRVALLVEGDGTRLTKQADRN
jgi:hypothetical protein